MTKLVKWTKNELSGYENDEDVPAYRRISSGVFRYDGINGSYRIIGGNLDTQYLNEETLKRIINFNVKDSANSIEKKIKSKESEFAIDRSYLASEVQKNSMNEFGFSIQCTKILQIFSVDYFQAIYDKIHLTTLSVLLELDKKFASLDDMDVNVDNIKRKELENMENRINVIIENSIVVTDKGKIKARNLSLPKSSIDAKKTKKSNIGEGSNKITSQTKIATDLAVSGNGKEKRFNKLFPKKRKL